MKTQTHLPNPKKQTGHKRIAILRKRIHSLEKRAITTGIRAKRLADYKAELTKLL
jgi:hypothetical protein